MYIVKFIKSAYYEDAFTRGKIQIGTFNYYKNIEVANLKDKKEGAGQVIIEGNNINTDVLRRFMSKDLPTDTIVRFEAGHGKLIDDISINCFIYCTSFVEHPHEVEPLREKAFPDKDKWIFLTREDYFERRCAEAIRREMKVAQASESVYIYSFNGKVVYTDLPKETHLNYEDIEKTIEPLLINLPFLYEKPAEYLCSLTLRKHESPT